MVESNRSNTARRQRRYKRDFDAHVRQALLPAPGDYVYIRQDPASKGKHKLSSRADGPYRVVTICSDGKTVRIRRDDHDESFSINRIEIVPPAAKPPENSHTDLGDRDTPPAMHDMAATNHGTRTRSLCDDSQNELRRRNERTGDTEQYVVDRIVGHRPVSPSTPNTREFRVK